MEEGESRHHYDSTTSTRMMNELVKLPKLPVYYALYRLMDELLVEKTKDDYVVMRALWSLSHPEGTTLWRT